MSQRASVFGVTVRPSMWSYKEREEKTMFRRPLFLALVVLFVGLMSWGCASREAPRPAAPPMEKSAYQAAAPVQEETTAATGEEALPDVERRIIYEADITLVVRDTEESARRVQDLAGQLGGYVVRANFYRQDGALAGNMTIRVPQEHFQEALDRLKGFAVRVDRENIRTNDVTSEYVDLQARLKNLEATEQELRELLKEVRQQTKSASDILEVYRELTRVREQIEEIKGRLQMLDKLTTYATINVELTPYELAQPVSTHPWDPRVTLHRAWGALLNVLRFLLDATIYLVVVVLPAVILALIPLTLVVFLLRFLWRWVRRPKKDVVQANASEDRKA